MQQSIVPPTFFFPLFLCPCTRLYDTAGHAPLAGSGRGLLATGSFTFKPPASANFMATPSAGSGTAQILAVNKELANAAPTQRRTTAKWKVPALPPRVFFVCFLAFLGAVGIKKLHETRAPRIMKILICACRKLNSIFSLGHAPKHIGQEDRRSKKRHKEPNEAKRSAGKVDPLRSGAKCSEPAA